MAAFVFLHSKQILFASGLVTVQYFGEESGYVYPPVGADLDFKLLVKEIALLQEVLPTFEQTFRVIIAFAALVPGPYLA